MPTKRQDILCDSQCQYLLRLHYFSTPDSNSPATSNQYKKKGSPDWYVCPGALYYTLQYPANDSDHYYLKDWKLDTIGSLGYHRDECRSKRAEGVRTWYKILTCTRSLSAAFPHWHHCSHTSAKSLHQPRNTDMVTSQEHMLASTRTITPWTYSSQDSGRESPRRVLIGGRTEIVTITAVREGSLDWKALSRVTESTQIAIRISQRALLRRLE